MAVRKEELLGSEARVYAFPGPRTRRKVDARARLALASVGAMVVAGFLLSTGPSGVSTASDARMPRKVTVQPGDTLWEIADRYAPASMDVRAFVDAIEELNGLEGSLQAGQKLRLPH